MSAARLQLLGEVAVPEIGILFYVYWVASWFGDAGSHSYEENEPFGELRWMPVDEVRSIPGRVEDGWPICLRRLWNEKAESDWGDRRPQAGAALTSLENPPGGDPLKQAAE